MHKAKTHILHFLMSAAVASVMFMHSTSNTSTLDFSSNSSDGFITFKSDGSATFHAQLPTVTLHSNLSLGPVTAQQATVTVLEAVSRVAQVTVNQTTKTGCTTCGQGVVQKPRQFSNSCNASNDYIEKEIDSLKDSNKYIFDLLSMNNQSSPFRSCIKTSLNNFSARVKKCDSPSSRLPSRFGTKACVSEEGKYIDLTVNSFELATDCLSGYLNGRNDEHSISEQKGALFTLLNHESGFHINAVSYSGAAGIGQFITGGVKWVNEDKEGWKTAESYINGSDRASCKKIADMKLTRISQNLANGCERISLTKQQPLSGLVYTFVHKRMVRKQLEKIMNASTYGQKSLSNLSVDDKEYLLRELSNWGHNTGSYGITKPFELFAASQKGRALLAAGNVKQFVKELRGTVYAWTRNYLITRSTDMSDQKMINIEKRAREASGFYDNINRDLKSAEQTAGKSCNINTAGAQ